MRGLTYAILPLILPGVAVAAPPPIVEVLVTSQRIEAPLLMHAGSATRLDAAAIAGVAPTHHAELVNRVPGAFIQRGSGQESLTALRSPVLTGPGSCGAFLFLEDGIPLRPVGFCNVNQLFEAYFEQADAVEVLRGPGSALYGANALHGIVNVLNPSPSSMPALGLSAEAGSDRYLRAALRMAGATPAGPAGLAVHATRDGGWRAATGLEEHKLTSALVRRAGPGELTLRLSATRLEQDTAGFVTGEEAYRDPLTARSNPNPGAFRDATSVRATAHYSQSPGGGPGWDLRGVLRSSRMEFLQHFLLGEPLERNGQDSVAVLASRSLDAAGGRLVAGLDLEAARGSLLQRQSAPTSGGPPAANAIRPVGRHYDYAVTSLVAAPYLQWERELAARLTLTAGLRAEWLRYDYDNRMLDGNTDETGTPCPAPEGCLYSRPADRRDTYFNPGPRLGLAWQLDGRSTAWLAASRGYRPPEATELYRLQRGQRVADLDSEHLDGLELGLRHSAPRLSFELVAFRADKDEVILRDSLGFNVSGGSTTHRGIEYGLDWRPDARWRAGASGTWARHRYAFTGGIEQGEQVTRGDDIDTAPRHLHSLRLGYDNSRLSGELEWLYVGAYWTNASNTARYAGHDLLNLRLAWAAGDDLRLALRLTNLLDRAYADRADFAFGSHRYFPGRGRAAFVEIAWQRD